VTAYLQPGDRIHLAMPLDGRLLPHEVQAETERIYAEQRAYYADHDVNVVQLSASSALTAPVVVAVFRDKPEAMA